MSCGRWTSTARDAGSRACMLCHADQTNRGSDRTGSDADCQPARAYREHVQSSIGCRPSPVDLRRTFTLTFVSFSPFFFCRLPSLEASLVTFPNFWWRHLHSSLTHTSSFDVRHCCPAHRKYTACRGLGVGTLILGRSRREKLRQLLEKYQSFTRVQNVFA